MTFAVLEYVLGTPRIDFKLLIAPAATSKVKCPFRRIGCGAFMPVEFIAPKQLPVRRSQSRQAGNEQSQAEHQAIHDSKSRKNRNRVMSNPLRFLNRARQQAAVT